MYSKILIIKFPRTEVQKPLVCHLAKDFDLVFNILNATIFPRKEGQMVLELSGTRKNFREGVRFLKDQGVKVLNASSEVRRNNNRCVHCGACTAVCPTGALAVKKPEMKVQFAQRKCSVCELCLTACPTRAMGISPSNRSFF